MLLRKPFVQLIDFILFSNIFIACCAMAQVGLTYLLLGSAFNLKIILFTGCSTLFLYNFSMIMAKPANPLASPHRRVHWIYAHYRLVLSLSALSLAVLIPLAFNFAVPTLILLAFTGLIAISYNRPLLKSVSNLRNIPGAKLFIISSVWTLTCVCMPIVELNARGSAIAWTDTLLLSLKRFMFITAITIPFDIRDLFQDKKYNLKTLPVLLGGKKTLLFCQGLLMFYIVILLIFVDQISLATLGLILTTLITGWLIFKSKWEKNEYFYFLFLDGTLILQFLCVYLLQWIF